MESQGLSKKRNAPEEVPETESGRINSVNNTTQEVSENTKKKQMKLKMEQKMIKPKLKMIMKLQIYSILIILFVVRQNA